MDFNFYKDLHNRELSRRKELDDAVNLPIGIITVFIGMLSFFIKDPSFIFSNCIMTVLFSIIVILLITSVCFVIGSMNNFIIDNSYKYLPFPDHLLAYEKELIEHNNQLSDLSESINFEDYLKDNFSEIATYNKKINDKRSTALYRSKNCLVITVFISLILIIIHLVKIY